MTSKKNARQKRIMVLGTGSGVGKSLIVAGLCRHAKILGLAAGPFKAQNMSNNAAVVPGGGEIGRAQYLQAQAAGLEPDVRMNPILLKPMGEGRSQVVFLGKPLGTYDIAGYRELKKNLAPKLRDLFWEYARDLDVVILEGAGSPAEINLLEEDLVNTRMARIAQAQALLIGDIEQGGVFASLWGTWNLLPPEDRAVIRWMGINKFRGDRSLLEPGIKSLEGMTGVPLLGVMEHLGALPLPDEDSYRVIPGREGKEGDVRLLAVEWPHLSNRSDFDPFVWEPGVSFGFQGMEKLPSGPVDCVFLPGTRQTIGDLDRFRDSPLYGWFTKYVAEGGRVVGICGGYQMMAGDLLDPDGVESSRPWTHGIDLLPFSVHFGAEKISRPVRAVVSDRSFPLSGELGSRSIEGYEIRHGRHVPHGGESLFRLVDPDSEADLGGEGFVSRVRPIWGAPVHGLFDDGVFRGGFLASLREGLVGTKTDFADVREDALDRLARSVHQAFPLLP
jgi:adenosylcobyric acid synthase